VVFFLPGYHGNLIMSIVSSVCLTPGKDPVDAHYESLKTKLEPLQSDGEDWERLNKYVQNTHGKTHSNYSLQLEEVS